MSKIKIKELCKRLKLNITDKTVFFKALEAPDFLPYFYKENVFDFTDQSSYYAIRYLITIFNSKNKTLIINIINKTISHNKINKIKWRTYLELIELIKLIGIQDLYKLNYKKLFKHQDSILLTQFVLEQHINYKYIDLYKLAIINILKYRKILGINNLNEYVIDYSIHYLNEIFENETTFHNLKMLLSEEEIFNVVLKKYNYLYKKFVIDNQFNKYHFDIYSISDIEKSINYFQENLNILNLIIYLLYLSCYNISNNRSYLNQLSKYSNFNLQKLVLIIIAEHPEELFDTLKSIFIKKNITILSQFCLSDIINILKSKAMYSKDEIKFVLKYLNKLGKHSIKLKYSILKELENKQEFFQEYQSLKLICHTDNQIEELNHPISGWIEDVSPIPLDNFKAKSIPEQIAYLNSNIEYSHKTIQKDEDTILQENENGLIVVFKNSIKDNINKYLNNKSIVQLKRSVFIIAFIEILITEINTISNINNAIKFIDVTLKNNEYLSNKQLIYAIISFNNAIIKNKPDNISKIFKFIKKIANNYKEDKYLNINNKHYDFYALNSIYGCNTYSFFQYLFNKKNNFELNNNELTFFNLLLTNPKFASSYYYVGIYYEFLINNYKQINIDNYISKLTIQNKQYFIDGYISYFTDINLFEKNKDIIIEAFKNGEIAGEKRQRLVQSLIECLLKYNKDDIYNKFESYFDESDYNNILRRIVFNKNLYDTNKVLCFWRDYNQKTNNFSLFGLEIFNKYASISDIEKYENNLKQFFSKSLNGNINSLNYFSNFLELLLKYTQQNKNYSCCFNILDKLVKILNQYQSINNEIHIIKLILDEFINNNKQENASIIARYITQNSGILNLYSKEFLKYLS